MIKTLDDVIHNVVYNDDIQALLKNPDLTHQYNEITQFQNNECDYNDTSIKEEGFQIGEPFDGDIENAPILFLSSNPAFNFDEVSPRYFPDSGKVFMPEHITQNARAIAGGNYLFDEVKKIFTEPKREMSFDEIKNFFKKRIQTSPAKNANDRTLRIPLKEGGLVAVPYWGTIRNNTEILLPPALKALWDGQLTPSQRAREIMKYAVCMEIVPFRSTMAEGVLPALNKCWNDFTKHLLEFSAAKVIVLARPVALNTFCANVPLTAAQQQTLLEHNIVRYKERLVVRAETAGMGVGTAFVPFNKYFDPVAYPTTNPNTLDQLQEAVASSPLVQKAIANGGILQN